jgi:hypothetical protein
MVLRSQGSTVKISSKFGDRSIPATLNDSRAAQEFASLFPLSATLEDYTSTEKIVMPPAIPLRRPRPSCRRGDW